VHGAAHAKEKQQDSMRGYPSKEKRPMSKELSVSGADGMDVIPAFSMLNVEVAIKAWCPRVKGEEYVDAVSGQKKTREVTRPRPSLLLPLGFLSCTPSPTGHLIVSKPNNYLSFSSLAPRHRRVT
jgi:hypothetical protein